MKGVDTNILARYFSEDDLVQLEQASQLIDQTAQMGDYLLVNTIVLCELVWTLESRYKYKKCPLIIVIESLLDTEVFVFEDRRAIEQALDTYRMSKAGFADCLINRINQDLGSTETYTFDRTTEGLDGFTVLVGT
ncbi:MAG: type II toxin-antitoxin system VapC family toxin [Tildeniella nuda ZEHNDER 1965/U140]|jgi:predicted nucleic-acid-binding protein|nr:type II toxin-antitoxin system VapC family toxin [Tildeniella nuda ZEHNDER 1965/U140]